MADSNFRLLMHSSQGLKPLKTPESAANGSSLKLVNNIPQWVPPSQSSFPPAPTDGKSYLLTSVNGSMQWVTFDSMISQILSQP